MDEPRVEAPPRWVARRVLVVDDEASARRALTWLFADSGLEVTAAGSGEEALAMLGAERYDLLLTDVRMPGIDGIELMRRALVLDPDLMVVLMTAFVDVRVAVRAMREGAFWYVTKPVDLDALMDVVRRAFELRALREEASADRRSDEGAPASTAGATLAEIERAAIEAAVGRSGGDLAAAARALGVSTPFLVARLRRYGEAP